MVQEQKQRGKPSEQNRRPRNKSTQLLPSDFDKSAKNIHWRKDSLSLNGAEKTEYPYLED
jgi:hypothetical protein